MKLRAVALVVVAVGTVGIAGCMDSTRVNVMCQWSDSLDRPLDLTQRFDREHLRIDAEIANELMVRFGDVRYRNRPDLARPLRDQCMTAMVDTIVARHHVTRAQITKAEFKRVWWADILAVFLPFAIVGALVTDAVTKRVCAHFDSSDRVMAIVSAARSVQPCDLGIRR
jgi:hypothetical protein